MKKALTMCLALVMAATIFMGNTASAQEPIPETKALVSIGETGYASLDEAVNEAADGDIITVSGDCTTVGLNLSKNRDPGQLLPSLRMGFPYSGRLWYLKIVMLF